LLLRRLLHISGAAYAIPTLQAVEQAPLTEEAAGEIADRRRTVELVESEVSEGEILLP